MTLIKNANLILEDRILENGALLIDGDIIAKVGAGALNAPADTVIDAQGAYIGPGFVDIHVHGAGPERDTSFNTVEAAERALHGH